MPTKTGKFIQKPMLKIGPLDIKLKESYERDCRRHSIWYLQ